MRTMKIDDYAKLKGVTPRQVRTWIEKGAVLVVRMAPRTGVRVLVPDPELDMPEPLPESPSDPTDI